MIILIPLGGIGSRFKECNYKLPKPLINVMGKRIISWVIDSLDITSNDTIVIPYNSELVEYRFESLIIKEFPKINFVFFKLRNQTLGAAHTVQLGLKHINLPDQPVICLDGDNFYLCNIIKLWKQSGMENNIFYFEDDNGLPVYSYIKTDGNIIIDIAEKNKISDMACCGSYAFKSSHELLNECTELIDNKIKQKGEYYMSGVIKQMISKGKVFKSESIDKLDYVCLGTPLDVRLFCNNYPKINAHNNQLKIKPKRYCFDLDNTLVTFPEIPGDYTTVKPIDSMIEFARYLKKIGHTIIIYTARRMKTHNGNVGKIYADIGLITQDTINNFNIPCDELYFGKPYADCYIDDLAISTFDNIEKELGYYKSTIDTRSFNSIKHDCVYTYTKTGTDLSGEIYWYEHMPLSIKDMFPMFFSSNKDSYVMEQINGIPMSRLLLSRDLTVSHLQHIINSLQRIHETEIPSNEPEINIYSNYCSKMQERYDKYDYTKFLNHKETFDSIFNALKEYEEKNLGKKTVIHGDPVMTNIMINQFGKIKLIDMRGKVGSIKTICGDSNYDWAKLYQSLIGYDEVLEDIYVSKTYKSSLIQYFETEFIKLFGSEQLEWLKYITASLLFTLIPLHDNEKCLKYYDLISSLI